MIVLAIDIGGTTLKAARVDENGRILELRKLPTPETLSEFRAAAAGLCRALGHGVDRVGIGCKGLVDPTTTRVEVLPGTVHYLEGHLLSDFFGVAPARADNDARVALLGEWRWGAARGLNHAILLTLGTGVGGGILSHGRIVRGASGIAGHLGHLTVDPFGLPCICGNRGCLETVFSARAIEAAAYSVGHRGVASRIARTSTCEDVFRFAAEGDPIAQQIVDQGIAVLAGAVAGLILALDPQRIIVGGQIASAGDFLLDPLRRQVWARTRLMLRRDIEVVPTEVEDSSGVVGAAALALEAA